MSRSNEFLAGKTGVLAISLFKPNGALAIRLQDDRTGMIATRLTSSNRLLVSRTLPYVIFTALSAVKGQLPQVQMVRQAQSNRTSKQDWRRQINSTDWSVPSEFVELTIPQHYAS